MPLTNLKKRKKKIDLLSRKKMYSKFFYDKLTNDYGISAKIASSKKKTIETLEKHGMTIKKINNGNLDKGDPDDG